MKKIEVVLIIGNPKVNQTLLNSVINSRELGYENMLTNVNGNKSRLKKQKKELYEAVLERLEEAGPLWSRK